MTIKTPPEQRFWKKVAVRGPQDCWLWTGDKTHHGYGRFVPHPKRRDENGKRPNPQLAHRLAWHYSGYVIPEGNEVCHKCDNPACVNPAHLFTGTHADNMRDCMKKGRLNSPIGERAGAAKLTAKLVKEIRSVYKPYEVSLNRLAKRFGVSKRNILFILQRKSWRHVV